MDNQTQSNYIITNRNLKFPVLVRQRTPSQGCASRTETFVCFVGPPCIFSRFQKHEKILALKSLSWSVKCDTSAKDTFRKNTEAFHVARTPIIMNQSSLCRQAYTLVISPLRDSFARSRLWTFS